MYCAIIGDIVDSRKIIDRGLVQKKLERILIDINSVYQDDIASSFTITIGDEFQGLLTRPDKVMEIIDKIKMQFYPEKLRFGIGFGEMITEIRRDLAIGSDGPAYHHARNSIDIIKQSEEKYGQPEMDIVISGEKENLFSMPNIVLSMMRHMESGWSEKQREAVYKSYLDSLNQKELAVNLGISQSSVQRRLSSAGYFTYISSKKALDRELTKIWEVHLGD